MFDDNDNKKRGWSLTRDFGNAGSTLSRKMGEKADGEEFRTVILGDKMLRTKGGMPRTFDLAVKEVVAAICKLFPLEETTLAGAATQADRLYYHDHSASTEVPEKRIFSTDGALSVVIRPLKRIRFKVKDSPQVVTVWLNDQSQPDDSFIQVTEAASAEFNATNQGVKVVENATRLHYAPEYTPKTTNQTLIGQMKTKGMGWVFKRVRQITASIEGVSGVTDVVLRFANYLGGDIKPASTPPAEYGEESLAKRTFYGTSPFPLHKLKLLKFNGANDTVTFATPGGAMTPFVDVDQVDPLQYTGSTDVIRSFESMTALHTFGQPWHGFMLRRSASDFAIWETPACTKKILDHVPTGTAPYTKLFYPSIVSHCAHRYDFSMPTVTWGEDYGATEQKLVKDFILHSASGRHGPFIDSYTVMPSDGFLLLYKEPGSNGAVWAISAGWRVNYTSYLVEFFAKFTGRFDNFLETKPSTTRELVSASTGLMPVGFLCVRAHVLPGGGKARLVYGSWYSTKSGSRPLITGPWVNTYLFAEITVSGTGNKEKVPAADYGLGLSASIEIDVVDDFVLNQTSPVFGTIKSTNFTPLSHGEVWLGSSYVVPKTIFFDQSYSGIPTIRIDTGESTRKQLIDYVVINNDYVPVYLVVEISQPITRTGVLEFYSIYPEHTYETSPGVFKTLPATSSWGESYSASDEYHFNFVKCRIELLHPDNTVEVLVSLEVFPNIHVTQSVTKTTADGAYYWRDDSGYVIKRPIIIERPVCSGSGTATPPSETSYGLKPGTLVQYATLTPPSSVSAEMTRLHSAFELIAVQSHVSASFYDEHNYDPYSIGHAIRYKRPDGTYEITPLVIAGKVDSAPFQFGVTKPWIVDPRTREIIHVENGYTAAFY